MSEWVRTREIGGIVEESLPADVIQSPNDERTIPIMAYVR